MAMQLREGELSAVKTEATEERQVELFFWLKIVKGETLEVGEKDVTRDFIATAGGLQVLNVVESLSFGSFEASAGALVFDEKLAFPKKINEAVGVLDPLDRFFEGGDSAARNPEDEKEFVPESLLLGLFAGFGGPCAGELNGPRLDFVP